MDFKLWKCFCCLEWIPISNRFEMFLCVLVVIMAACNMIIVQTLARRESKPLSRCLFSRYIKLWFHMWFHMWFMAYDLEIEKKAVYEAIVVWLKLCCCALSVCKSSSADFTCHKVEQGLQHKTRQSSKREFGDSLLRLANFETTAFWLKGSL